MMATETDKPIAAATPEPSPSVKAATAELQKDNPRPKRNPAFRKIEDVPQAPPPQDGEERHETKWAELPDDDAPEKQVVEKPKPDPKAEVKPEPTLEAEKPRVEEFPRELLEFGRNLGVDESELREFGTPAKAERYLRRVVQAYEAGVGQNKPPEPAVQKPEATEAGFDLKAFEAEPYAQVPEIRAMAKAFHEEREARKRIEEQFGQVAPIIQQLQAAEHNRQQDHFRRQMDAGFNDLREYVHVFGEGEAPRLIAEKSEANKSFLEARSKVVQKMKVIAAGYEYLRMPLPDVRELQTEAVRALYGSGQPTDAPTEHNVVRTRDETGRFTTVERSGSRNTTAVAQGGGDPDRDTLLK